MKYIINAVGMVVVYLILNYFFEHPNLLSIFAITCLSCAVILGISEGITKATQNKEK